MLSDAEAEEIELLIIEDAEFAEKMLCIEESLVEAFLSNSLSEKESEQFTELYLSTRERVRNVEITDLLRRFAVGSEAAALTPVSSPVKNTPGLLQRFSSLRFGLRVASASIILIFAVAAVWLLLRPKGDSELLALQDKYNRINQDQTMLANSHYSEHISLLPNNLRSASSMVEIDRGLREDDVSFRLALSANSDRAIVYDVEIIRDSTVVFVQTSVRAYSNSEIPEVRLRIPRSVFSTGNYDIRLKQLGGSMISYQFVVR